MLIQNLKVHLYVCVCVCTCVCAMVHMCRAGDDLWELVLSFHDVGPGN